MKIILLKNLFANIRLGAAGVLLFGACASGGADGSGGNPDDDDDDAGVETAAQQLRSDCAAGLAARNRTRLDVCLHFEDDNPVEADDQPRPHTHYELRDDRAFAADLMRFRGEVVGVFSDQPLTVRPASALSDSRTATGTQSASSVRNVERVLFPRTEVPGSGSQDKTCGVGYVYFVDLREATREDITVTATNPRGSSVIFEEVTSDCRAGSDDS